jgi:hypothetical protein
MSKVFRLGFVLMVALVVGLALLWAQTGESQADDPPPLDITTDGKLMLTFSSGANVKLVFVEASYNNDFGIASPVDQHIFYCKDVPPGYTVDLGTFSPGELMFKLTSPEAYTYYTGPADRNPDNVVHALIERLSPASAQIQWEDLYGGGDLDYNDCVVDIVVEPVEADLKIVGQEILAANCIDPAPDNIDVSADAQICVKKVLHNNGPWEPVDIDIDATATAPTGCTVVEKDVPDSVSDVPVSVNQVVDEVWTINCTETGLKTFVFDNSIDVATLYVSDPDPGTDSSHKLLSVMDDASAEEDADGDGVYDAFDPCPVNPDCDDDGVSDGPIDPDGDGPIIAGPDNCPLVPNADQADFDGDGVGDACDTDDSDADGFLDGVELYVGTDPVDNCPDDPSDDAWPLDIDQSCDISVTGDVFNYAGRIGATLGDPNWWQRLDLDTSGDISVTGDVYLFAGRIGEDCT